MSRGSRPGERRGGRQRGTPNRRTVLADRISVIGLDRPASRHEFLECLIKDARLPAGIRVSVVPRCFPPKRTSSSRSGRGVMAARKATGRDVIARSSRDAAAVAITDWTPEALDACVGIV